MTDRGLLMTGPMALAAYRGIKTQMRRPLNPQPHWNIIRERWELEVSEHHMHWTGDRPQASALLGLRENCQFCHVGDRIYVRETFALSQSDPDDAFVDIKNPAYWDGAFHKAGYDESIGGGWTNGLGNKIPPPWRPSIHMPKWAARTWGTITSVRVERSQSITEEDASAEGVSPSEAFLAFDGDGVASELSNTARGAFACLWDSLYTGELNWTANPWVWVIEWRKDES